MERVNVSQTACAGTIVLISQCKELLMNSDFSSVLDSAETSIRAPIAVKLSARTWPSTRLRSHREFLIHSQPYIFDSRLNREADRQLKKRRKKHAAPKILGHIFNSQLPTEVSIVERFN
jgi:hypothetical protein